MTYNGSLTHIRGDAQQRARHHVPDPVLHQHDRRPHRLWRGRDRFGTRRPSDRDDRCQRQRRDQFFLFAEPFAPGLFLTATATNLTTGDTSEFSAYVIPRRRRSSSPLDVYPSNETSGFAVITVSRTLSTGHSIGSVRHSPGRHGDRRRQDYIAVSRTADLPRRRHSPRPSRSRSSIDHVSRNTIKTVNLALTNGLGGSGSLISRPTAVLKIVDNDPGTSRVFIVTNTQRLRAGLAAAGDPRRQRSPGPTTSSSPSRHPWTPTSTCLCRVRSCHPDVEDHASDALPAITDQVTIDGYSQGHSPSLTATPNAVNSDADHQRDGSPDGWKLQPQHRRYATTPRSRPATCL